MPHLYLYLTVGRLFQTNRQLQKDPTTEIQQLQEELIASKLREAEANLSMKELRQRVADLDKYWQVGSAGGVSSDRGWQTWTSTGRWVVLGEGGRPGQVLAGG